MRAPVRSFKSLHQHPAFELESVLLKPMPSPVAPEALVQAVEGAVHDRLTVVALWPASGFADEWWPGDFASLRLSFGPPGGAERLVTVRAEPMERVRIEVGLRGSRGIRPALPPRIGDALAAIGFEGPPGAVGKAMQVQADAPADEAGCAPLAQFIARLLIDVLGYEGHLPLSEYLVRGEAGDLKAQVTAVTPTQVRQLVVASGLGQATPGPPPTGDGPPTLTMRTATGGWFEIRMLAPAGAGRFGALDCTAAVEGVPPLSVARLADINARLFGCAVCQVGDTVMLRGGFALYAGVAMASVLAFLQHLATQLEHLRPLLAGRMAPGGSTAH